ncbi:hypothetical protein MJO28_001965 [Puccinia striiformis f. sp. tritici]|uniref:Large ribosomal subunit protein mL44 n=2 Tax=Puccinia striiformis f. sp. tritici TaxID=168172 RepID=A0A0L0VET9_9BASI|nr:hypothetical protein Pst134EB_003890 [Puccinia striiformis f. sp. tritici]KAI7961476.1 hypothetical protein MJO28_001965 [Puccinia striiformis f. sp. tritici]KAI7966297.1 hypothetical protein MJO29_002045 [Puccinia striiformis f. sp. tritici]KNE97827.1 hypothetical protein PSTG_08848 [Puccinia striiformis f. sp. tritici PST-78]
MDRSISRNMCVCIRGTMLAKRKKTAFMIDPRPICKFISTRTPLRAQETITKTTPDTANSLTEAEFVHRQPNRIRPPSKNTSNVYLHRIHSLLYPPPPSEIAAFAYRIPKLPKDLISQPDSLKWVERCLVSPSFWQGIEEGDVRIDDLKKAISKWVVTRSSAGQSDRPEPMYLPGKVTATIAPDQSMDANVKMHPFGSKRRSELRAQQAGIDPDVDLLDLESNWIDNYPKFTNFLDDEKLHNEQLATLGNSILGMLGSEWLDRRYPYLPTKAFQAALTMYVGPRTCADVARLWGVSSGTGLSNLTIEGKPKIESAGVYAGGIFDLDGKPKNKGQKHKQDGSKGEEVSHPGLLRWRRAEGFAKDQEIGSRASAFKQGILYEDAMASVSRAFVGMVYSLHGMKAARQFVRANWFSRRAQVGDLLKFTNPFLVLKYTMAKYHREPPVARLLRESGSASATPIFVVGSYSGTLKLGEAFGTSKKMAEYRAHEDALRRIYLSPGVEDQGLGSEFPALPSDTLIESEGYVYQAPKTLGDLEVDEASAANRSGRMADQSFEDILFARRQESLLKFKTALASRSTSSTP